MNRRSYHKLIFLVTLCIASSLISGYTGTLFLDEEGEANPLRETTLQIFFSTGDIITTRTDENGIYSINTSEIFCWTECNLIPTITGIKLSVQEEERGTTIYTRSNRHPEEGHEWIVLDYNESNTSLSDKKALQEKHTTDNNERYEVTLIAKIFTNATTFKLATPFLQITSNETETFYEKETSEGGERVFTLTPSQKEKLHITYHAYARKEKPILYSKSNEEWLKVPREEILITNGTVTKYTLQEKFSIQEEIPYPPLPFIFSPSVTCYSFDGRVPTTTPTVFVHGLHGHDNYYWGEIPYLFEADVFQIEYFPANSDVRYHAYQMKHCMNLFARYFAQEFHLISHSMGGLVVQAYIDNLTAELAEPISPYGKGRVSLPFFHTINSSVTLGTPWHGAFSANKLYEGNLLLQQAFKTTTVLTDLSYAGETFREAGFRDLMVGSALTWNIQEKGFNNDTRYLSITGIESDITPINFLHYEADQSDSIVAAASASLLHQGQPLVLLKMNHVNEHGKSALPFAPACNAPLSPCNITRLLNGILAFQRGYNWERIQGYFELELDEYILREGDTIPFNEGMVLIRITPEPFCISCLSLSRRDKKYSLTENQNSKILTYYGETGEKGLTLPNGTYQLLIPEHPGMYVPIEILPLKTTRYEVSLPDDLIPLPPPVTCYEDEDCGETKQIGNIFCKENEVHRTVAHYTCRNPGTIESSCRSLLQNERNKTCPHLCIDGACIDEEESTHNLVDLFAVFPENRFKTNTVPLNISTQAIVDKITYIDTTKSRVREYTLCRKCNEYGVTQKRTRRFSEGLHNIDILAYRADEVHATRHTFTVDSRMPRIEKVKPRRGVTNGTFTIQFKEDNPSKLSITVEGQESFFDLSRCLLSRGRHYCTETLDVSPFNNAQKEIEIHLVDEVDNEDRVSLVLKIDTVAPIINEFTVNVVRRRAEFFVHIIEENLEEINYIDLLDSRPREKRLCTRVRNNICSVRKSFRRGHHHVEIRVRDKAGNTAEETLEFTIP